MSHSMLTRLLLLTSLCFASSFSMAQPDEHQKHSHENTPHVHGLAAIQLVIGQKQIELNFESPANNIVGFEHSAKTHEDQTKLHSANAILSQPQSLFEFNGTSCNVISSTIDMNGLQHPSTNHSHNEETHKEITAAYVFRCNHIQDIKSINIHMFKHFPNLTEIHIQWVSDTKQGASKLQVNNSQLFIGN